MPSIKTSQTKLIFAVSLFIAIFHNFAFFRNIAHVYADSAELPLILLSTGILHLGVLILLLSMAGTGRFLKSLLIIILLISSVTAYFEDQFNIIIDSEMLVNVLQTNPAEATDLLNLKLLVYFLLLGLFPAILVSRIKFQSYPLRTVLIRRLTLVLGSIVFTAMMIFSYSDFFSSFLREQKKLRFYANPSKALESVYKLSHKYFKHDQNLPWVNMAADARIDPQDDEKELVVLVIGETARAANFSLNGYSRNTNPLLQHQQVVSFNNVHSCGTTTAVSVPCMFSFQQQQNYDRQQSSHMDNILDVLQRTGVQILWRDNNTGHKGVADRIDYQIFQDPTVNPVCDEECRDIGMLEGLDQWLQQHQGKDKLLILHQMGSHGPAYYKRYPKEFEAFKPACHNTQLDQCSTEEVVNAYDNTILYTDFFLNAVIEWLKTHQQDYETSMLYVSDHGESLGENGIYLHGFPYSFAPDTQTHIPVIFWAAENNPDFNYEHVSNRKSEVFTHDNLTQTLIGLFEINSDIFHPAESIISVEQDN